MTFQGIQELAESKWTIVALLGGMGLWYLYTVKKADLAQANYNNAAKAAEDAAAIADAASRAADAAGRAAYDAVAKRTENIDGKQAFIDYVNEQLNQG
jgi:hypothetical protein